MNILIAVVIAVVVAALLIAASWRLRPREAATAPAEPTLLLEARSYFFSRAEQKFYAELVPAAGALGLAVFPKVGLNDVFRDRKGADRKQYYHYARMHVDFLLVSRKGFHPIAGVELDGPSHGNEVQQERDGRKEAAFKAAALPLLRFANGAGAGAIRQQLGEVIGTPAAAG